MKQPEQIIIAQPNIMAAEPAYDANQLLKDHAYRYDMVDQFTAYMNSIEPYADRVRYYMKISVAMNLSFSPITYSTYSSRIQDRPGTYAGRDTFVDEQGDKIPVLFKYWQMPDYTSDQERAILHRTYFEDYYLNSRETFLGIEVKRLNNLTDNYSDKIANHVNPNGFKQRELNTTQRQINAYQEMISEWAKSYPHLTDKALLKQLAEISTLVEDEINGSAAIRWELFIKSDYLEPLALLWDVVTYSLFLKTEIIQHKATPKHVTLSERERILVYCYKQKAPIRSGEPGYQDYIRYCTPKKRVAYPNDSKRMADLLIASIERIKPHLTDLEKQQAQSEIDTIEAKFHNQL